MLHAFTAFEHMTAELARRLLLEPDDGFERLGRNAAAFRGWSIKRTRHDIEVAVAVQVRSLGVVYRGHVRQMMICEVQIPFVL